MGNHHIISIGTVGWGAWFSHDGGDIHGLSPWGDEVLAGSHIRSVISATA
ncbi:MAG: hypothetical protein GY713_08785 [Actinomycetia bacterium]|nr:hypothetical protein [Actinomycetes bacterium]